MRCTRGWRRPQARRGPRLWSTRIAKSPRGEREGAESMRALVLVLDSAGVGAAPDAGRYGDERSDTLGHILERHPDLRLPTLRALGLDRILGRDGALPLGCWGRMR